MPFKGPITFKVLPEQSRVNCFIVIPGFNHQEKNPKWDLIRSLKERIFFYPNQNLHNSLKLQKKTPCNNYTESEKYLTPTIKSYLVIVTEPLNCSTWPSTNSTSMK